MKVVKNDNNQPFTLAELEAIRQFEQSNRDGGAVIRPAVKAGKPTPNCTTFLKQIGRFAITIFEGHYTVEGRDWFLREDDGSEMPVDDPLEQAWQAAKSVRIALEPKLGFKPYAIAVAWFPDMEEKEDILDEVEGRSVGVLCGQVDLAPVLAALPRDDQLQTQLGMGYIEEEMVALSHPAAAETEPAEKSPPVNGGVGALNIGRVETMNVYITIVYGDDDAAPPVVTVQGQ